MLPRRLGAGELALLPRRLGAGELALLPTRLDLLLLLGLLTSDVTIDWHLLGLTCLVMVNLEMSGCSYMRRRKHHEHDKCMSALSKLSIFKSMKN